MLAVLSVLGPFLHIYIYINNTFLFHNTSTSSKRIWTEDPPIRQKIVCPNYGWSYVQIHKSYWTNLNILLKHCWYLVFKLIGLKFKIIIDAELWKAVQLIYKWHFKRHMAYPISSLEISDQWRSLSSTNLYQCFLIGTGHCQVLQKYLFQDLYLLSV